MESLWKVWFSRRRKVYVRIARRYGSTPWRVYYLGHGGRCRSLKDMQNIGKRYSGRGYFAYLPLVIID